jgi:hypothetical protein
MSTISVKTIERNRSRTAGHYHVSVLSAKAASANRDGREASTSHYPRKAQRRQQCATAPNIFVTAQPSVARSATASLASSGTTHGEPPSVQGSALTASRIARMVTADGYLGKSPDTPPNVFHASATVFCFALGAPNEIHLGEWQDAAPKAPLRVLRSVDRSRLPARSRDAPHLLRSRLLRRSLQKRVRASRKPGNGIMSVSQPNKPGPWPESPDEHRSRRKGHCDESL